MPIFDYVCSKCGAQFESLVRRGEVVSCSNSSCESTEVERVPSRFAIAGAGRRSESPPPAAAGAGAGAGTGAQWGYSDEKNHYGGDDY